MTQQTILERVRLIVAAQADVPLEQVMEYTAFDSLDLDSLDAVEICIKAEQEFELEIPTKEIQHWKRVSDVALYIAGIEREMAGDGLVD